MQKIYVLLRQDKQTGPYSLQELLQFDLKPYDLIWIEGQSAGWYYPQEISALHPYLGFLPKKPTPTGQVPPEEKKVAVQMPVISEAPPPVPLPQMTTPAPTEMYQSFKPASKDLEEAIYAQFRQPVDEKKPAISTTSTPQKKNTPNTVVVAVTTVLIVGGVFAASWIMNRQPAGESTTETVTPAPIQNETIPSAVATDANIKKEKLLAAYKQKEAKKKDLPSQTSVIVNQDERRAKKETVFTSIPNSESSDYPDTPSQTAVEQVQQNEASPAIKEETTAPQEKRKTVKDRFLDLFRKKPDEKQSEETRPAETESGERVATRRETNLLQAVHVRFDVPNDWMMGIKGAKATLVNRSTEKLRSATVEVLYYNDDNELLQKKVVTFGKIEAKESGTIPIPDHPTATKVDYNVLSVTGSNQPPA